MPVFAEAKLQLRAGRSGHDEKVRGAYIPSRITTACACFAILAKLVISGARGQTKARLNEGDRMPGKGTFAFIGCRLLALYVIYLGAQKLGFAVLHIRNAIKVGAPLSLMEPAILGLAIDLCAILFFWFGAGWISSKVSVAAGAEDPSSASRQELIATAIAIAGAILLITSIPGIVGFVAGFAFWGNQNFYHLSGLIPLIVTGVICLVGPDYFSGLIMKLRRWGVE